MKCYFCLTEPDEQNSVYLDLLYVSLKSARENTTLDLYVLYDGSTKGRCYKILKKFDVHIIQHQFSHKQYLEKTYPEEYIISKLGHKISYEKIAGTFMRFDIPFIEQEDEFVFYADIDVIFLKDFSYENFDKPKYLSATAEVYKDLNNMKFFNAGILYLNVKNMRDICNQVFNMLKNGVRNKINLFDQGYLNQLCFNKMTIMPLEFNWKPYWGYNDEAYIIHMHAMKPGGTLENSGFNMTKEALFEILKGHYKDIDGYIYYLLLYYKILGKNGDKWIASFISLIFTSIIEVVQTYDSNYINSENRKLKKKYKKYKKRSLIKNFVILFLLSVIIYLGTIYAK